MKSKHLPFLYYFIIPLLINVLGSFVTKAQKKQDSLLHYHDVMTNPKGANDLSNAYGFFQKNLKQNLKQKDTIAAITDLRYMASIQNTLGLIYDSEQTVVKALKLLDRYKKKDTTNASLGLYNQLGMIYNALYDYDKAIGFYGKALEASSTVNDSSTIMNNIAYTYFENGKYDLAKDQFEKVYKNSKTQKNDKMLAMALNNLGVVRAKLNDPQGIENMLESLRMRSNQKDTKGLYSSYKSLSKYYHEKNDAEKANFYGEEGYKLAKAINSLSYIEDALSNIMLLKSDPMISEYTAITDSIAKNKQLQENKFAEMKYNYTEFQRKAQKSQLATLEQRAKTITYQFLGLFIFLIAVFFYMLIRHRHKKENMRNIYETETRISKKVHDEVANDVYQLMTKLQSNSIQGDPVIDQLENIYVKTRDISKENSDIIQSDFKSQLQDLFSSYQSDDVNIMTKNLHDVEWHYVSNDKKITLYRVLQELMTNMKKHSEATLVAITFQQKKKKLTIIYKDNGVGADFQKGFGTQNMEHRMASIKGIIIFETAPNLGFKATLTV